MSRRRGRLISGALLGPNIDSIGNLPTRITCRFIKTGYKTVVSQIHRVDPTDGDLAKLVEICSGLHDPTLIFCRSFQRVRDVTQALLDAGIAPTAVQGSIKCETSRRLTLAFEPAVFALGTSARFGPCWAPYFWHHHSLQGKAGFGFIVIASSGPTKSNARCPHRPHRHAGLYAK
jgi:hypothetical protein